MFANLEIIKRAEAIALRDGGSWGDHIDTACRELREPELKKIVVKQSTPVDERLIKDAIAAQLRHLPGSKSRVVIGEVEIPTIGRLHVEHDQNANVVSLHDVRFKLSDVDKDLRDTFVAGSAAFDHAQDAADQVTARNMIGFVVRALIERHDDFIGAKVREKMADVRYGA